MATFRVNGKDLELPDTGTLTLDESIVVYSYSGLTLDQLGDLEGLHPGLLAGLLHVGVARANPDQKAKDIEKAVRGLNLVELIQSVQDPELQEEPLDLGSREDSDSKLPPSGSILESSSETSRDPSHLRPTGTLGLASSESDLDQALKESVG